MSTASYVAVRDDSSSRSLTANESDFLQSCAQTGLRVDGRGINDFRKAIRLQLGRWDNGAECTVQWGVGTRVTSLCTASLVPPNPDRPNEGMVHFTVDLSPMAGTSFRQAPSVSTAPSLSSTTKGPNFSDQNQRLLSNRILRCIERIVLIGGALDTEALVLVPGKWVWRLTVALTVIDDGGNILDACVFAAMAALRHYRKAHVDFSGQDETVSSPSSILLPTLVPSTVKEPSPLPLHHTPLSVSFSLMPADGTVRSATSTSTISALADPTDREELVQSGTLTIAMNVHSEVCLLDYGGGCELSPSKLKECWNFAAVAIKELCQLLEGALSEADDQARKMRIHQLQGRQQTDFGEQQSSPADVKGTPYFRQTHDNDSSMDVEPKICKDDIQQAQNGAEEEYRQQALDYSKGHRASGVREDSSHLPTATHSKTGSLISAMLKSVSQVTQDAPTMPFAGDVEHKRRTGKEVEGGLTNPATGTKLILSSVEKSSNGTSYKANPISGKNDDDDDDDDDEAPTVLESEFGSASKGHASSTVDPKFSEAVDLVSSKTTAISDLSMAIKKKRKKSGKAKKK